MIGQVSVAAAAATVGTDLLAGTTWRVAGHARRMVAIGLAGSAAALDSKCDVFIGNQKVGDLYNSQLGANNRDSMFRVGSLIPAGTPISVIVTDAPATNPLNVSCDLA